MVSNQVLGVRLAAGCLIVGVVLGGCAHTPPADEGSSAPAPVASGNATSAPAPAPMTATEAALAAGSNSAPEAAAAAPATDTRDMVKPGAPKEYIVKRGDTLWGIASMYLKDPWLWPEVWIINPQVPNPHLIYPGDKLALAYGANGMPQVRLMESGAVRLDPRLRSEALESAIPTIPYSAIEAFLSRPAVMTSDQISHAPYVLAFRAMHQIAGSGNEVYIKNLSAAENARYAVVHIEGPLVDPDDGKVVGYQATYTATALVQRSGDPAKAMLIDPARETVTGDKLLSSEATETPLTFAPRPPAGKVHGQIIDVVGGTNFAGQYEVVVINRGKSQGIEPGNVLAIDQKGDTTRDLGKYNRQFGDGSVPTSFAPMLQLPSERIGTMLVFKVYDRLSYGLIVGSTDSVYLGDYVRNP
jgi:LysM repeat protein